MYIHYHLIPPLACLKGLVCLPKPLSKAKVDHQMLEPMEVWCLKRYVPHRLRCFNAWPIGDGTLWECGIVEADAVLLEEGCHCGGKL